MPTAQLLLLADAEDWRREGGLPKASAVAWALLFEFELATRLRRPPLTMRERPARPTIDRLSDEAAAATVAVAPR